MKASAALVALVLVLAGCGGEAAEKSAEDTEASTPVWKTDFARHTVPLSEITSGGPGKDGIPAIDHPKFVPVAEAGFLEPREPVVELELNGVARAYPIQILIWHEIANDVVEGTPVAVTFCPLCNTSLVFDRRVNGRVLDFGTTGNLRNSDLVMYDRQTESWWQQFGGQGIVGRYSGVRLRQLPSRIVAWGRFRSDHPTGLVLSRDTGYSRSYGENPYEGYDDVASPPFFSARNSSDDRLPPKEVVVYVERGGEAAAVPFSTLRKRRIMQFELGGSRLVVRWRGGVASALDEAEIRKGRDVGAAEVLADGRLVPFDQPFWFAVAAFRPDVRVIR